VVELLSLAEVCSAERPPDDPVAMRGGTVLRRDEFLTRVWAWRDLLVRRHGKHWALYTSDSYEFACVLFGAWYAGKTVFLPADSGAGILDRLRPQVDGFIGEFALAEALTAPEAISSRPSGTALEPEAVVLVVFTSGTTGAPVAIPKTVRQLDREVRALHSLWGVEVDRVPVLASVPHHHMYGLPFKVLWPLCRGAAFSSDSVGYPEDVADRLTRAPGVWVASPALLKRLPEDLSLAAARPNVRMVFSAGSPLPFEAAQRCTALLGRPVVEIYGSSETGAVAWRLQTEPDTPWRPLPGVLVARSSEREVLTVRSPWLATEDEWLTADRGEVYADGSFCLLGRVDRIVKIEERRVSLAALEQALGTSPLVREARVLVLPDGRLAAAVILHQDGKEMLRLAGKPAVVERLRAWLRPHAEGAAIPRRWRFVDSFPQDPMGKVADAALQELLTRPDPYRREPQVLHHTYRGREVELRVFIPTDLLYFEGHFPQAPILPGVIQVEWAVAFARRFFEVPQHFRRLEMLKFQRVVGPGTTVMLTLEYLVASQTVTFRYVSDVGQHSSGRVVFGD
jgi:3-hydroxymyristoyl/3-hydroxydecanoyl-(acyl carrier protein) dehydratase